MLIYFIMATLGVFLFSEIKEGTVIDKYKNFETFDDAFLLLFAISTGEEWNLYMHDCSKTPPNCKPGLTCGHSYAWLYFVVFIVLVTHIMLNLFILVIIEQFDKYFLDSENAFSIFQAKFDQFEETWVAQSKKYDCRMIKENELMAFYKRLPSPMGMAIGMDDSEAQRKLLKMGVKSEDGFIYFNELLYRIMRELFVTDKFQLNNKMTVIELTTQYKLFKLTQASKGNVPKSNDVVRLMR